MHSFTIFLPFMQKLILHLKVKCNFNSKIYHLDYLIVLFTIHRSKAIFMI